MKKYLPVVFYSLIIIIVIWGLFAQNGIRAAVANNLWSVEFLNHYFKAESSAEEVPLPPQTHTHAGLLLTRQALNAGEVDVALNYLIPQVEAGDPYAQAIYAEVLYTKGDYEQACELWSKLGLEQTLEQVLREAQASGKAGAEFFAARGLYLINPEKFTGTLVQAYKILYDTTQAETLLKQTMLLYPDSENQANWYRYLGDIYRDQGLYDQAVSTYLEGLSKEPQDLKLWRNLGLLYRGQLKQPEKALPCFQKMTEISPKDAFAYLLLGQTYEELGLFTEAIQVYQTALQLEPENEQAQQALIKLTETP